MQVQAQHAKPAPEVELGPSRSKTTLLLVVVLGATALLVLSPFFFRGEASGHDFEFHVASWMEVARQWHEGIWYPRWAARANFGYGEPRFIFYPPESWILGAAMSLLLPWGVVPGAYCWLMLVIAGLGMYRLAREWLPERDAAAAAVLFAVNPYHLLLVYWRSDFAEMLASAISPLVVLCAVKLGSAPRRFLPLLALLVATTWLANAPAGVIVSYALALLLLVMAVRDRSWRVLLYGGGAIALGLALAAFYLVPAAYEQPWVNISEALSAGLKPAENFLFTVTADPDHTRFNFLVSWAAVGEIAVAILAAGLAAPLRRAGRSYWWPLLVLGIASALMMLPVTALLWTYLPKMRFVQFPWRWMFPFGVVFAAMLSSAVARTRIRLRPLVWVICAVALFFAGRVFANTTWWDKDTVSDLQEAILLQGSGYEGTDEYQPAGADRTDLVNLAPLIAETTPTAGSAASGPRHAPAIRVLGWYPEHKIFEATVGAPTTLILRLLNYPAWRVEVNGKVARAGSSPGTAQMLVSVPAGSSRVQIDFVRTPDRLWGAIISVLAIAVLLCIFAMRPKNGATDRQGFSIPNSSQNRA
jgi:hypothetical protein